MLTTVMDKLAEQAPAATAVIVIVVLFIRTMQEQRTTFNQMMTERDRLFFEALQQRDELFQQSMLNVAERLNGVEDNVLRLDVDARHAMQLKPPKIKKKRVRNL